MQGWWAGLIWIVSVSCFLRRWSHGRSSGWSGYVKDASVRHHAQAICVSRSLEVKRAKRYAHHWPLSTAEVKNVCLRVVVRHCHIYYLQDTDGCFGAVQRECLLPGGLEQWSPKWGAHDIPWGCEEENKPRRPSADIMYIYCVPIYVYIYIYIYIYTL
jgi:hypothetical protein